MCERKEVRVEKLKDMERGKMEREREAIVSDDISS